MRDQIVKRVHDLLDRCRPIPPVYIQDVDVQRAQLFEGGLHGDVEGLCVISGVIYLVTDLVFAPLEVGCVLKIKLRDIICGHVTRKVWTCLGRNDKLVSDASFLGPLAYEFFRGSILTDNGCQS